MNKHELSASQLSKITEVSGLDGKRFDKLSFRVFGEQIADMLPQWAVSLMLTFGWRWPMWFNGVSVWQCDPGSFRQNVIIDSETQRFEYEGNVGSMPWRVVR